MIALDLSVLVISVKCCSRFNKTPDFSGGDDAEQLLNEEVVPVFGHKLLGTPIPLYLSIKSRPCQFQPCEKRKHLRIFYLRLPVLSNKPSHFTRSVDWTV